MCTMRRPFTDATGCRVAASEEERAKSEASDSVPQVTDQQLMRQAPFGLAESLLYSPGRVGGTASSIEGMGLGHVSIMLPPPAPEQRARHAIGISSRHPEPTSHMLTRLVVSLGAHTCHKINGRKLSKNLFYIWKSQ